MQVLTVTLNPCIDTTLYVDKLKKNALVRSSEEFSIAGGKGANAARQLVRLGIKASAFVLVGGDSGNTYLKLVERDGVQPIPYRVDQPTRRQMTFFEKSSGRYHTVLQEAKPVPRKHEESLIEAIASNLPGKSLLVLSGSTPGNGLFRVYRRVLEETNRQKTKVILDTYGRALAEGIKASPFAVKPNKVECEAFLGFPLRSDPDFRRAYAAFHRKGISLVVISLGSKGFRASFEGIEYVVSAPKIREVNPIASGDALAAGIAYGMLKKLSIEETLRWGCATGAANAAEWAVANCSKNSIKKLLGQVCIKKKTLQNS